MEHAEVGPNLSLASIVRYLERRIPTLKPPSFAERRHLLNPFPALKKLNKLQWNFVCIAFCAWAWDAVDFFSVSLTVPDLSVALNKSVAEITWGITLVLMFRSVGAVIFGLASDKWGRKWPFVANLAMFVVLELGLGFVQTYRQFLAIRALFGISMGGMYGTAAATALDDCPVEARGIVSGFVQQGYAIGYLLVVLFNRALVPTTKESWRSLYWFSAGPPVLLIIWRICLPETEYFKRRQHEQRDNLGKTFIMQARQAAKTHWLIFIYLTIFMTGVSYLSHGSQDLYPTRLTKQLLFSSNASTVTNSVANIGGFVGGVFFGHMSQFLGRRLSFIVISIIGGALIYPWGFSTSSAGLNASVFFFQGTIQGVLGVVPIYLSELAPEALRSFVVGTTYQLSNLAASASSTIEAKLGTKFPLESPTGQEIYDYGKVMAILVGAAFALTATVAFLGPERHVAVTPSLHEVPIDVEEDKTFKVEYQEATDNDVARVAEREVV